MLAPVVLLDDKHNGETVKVMQIVQDEYAESVLGTIQAFRRTCLYEKCPYSMHALS